MCLPYTSLLHSYWGVFTTIKVKCRSISSAFIVKMSIIYKNYNSAQNCWDIIFHVFFNFSPCNFIVETEQSRPPSHPLTNVVLARMGSESIAYEAEGRMGYWLRGHEGERNNCFTKIQLVLRSKISRHNNLKQDFHPFFVAKNPALFAASGL